MCSSIIIKHKTKYAKNINQIPTKQKAYMVRPYTNVIYKLHL
jgi:hypothetical protein